MAFTRSWSTSTPADGNNANTADNELRNLRVDIDERLTALGFDLTKTDDIWQPSAARYLFVHWSAFNLSGETVPTISAPHLEHGTSAANTLYAPIHLPRGVVITEISAHGVISNSSTSTIKLCYADITAPASPTVTTIATLTFTAVQGIQTATLGPPHTVDALPSNMRYYFLESYAGTSGFAGTRLQGVRIKYTPTTNFW